MTNIPEPDPRDASAEAGHMDKVDREDWGPTEPDEEAVLGRLFTLDPATGTYHFQVGDPQ